MTIFGEFQMFDDPDLGAAIFHGGISLFKTIGVMKKNRNEGPGSDEVAVKEPDTKTGGCQRDDPPQPG
jgi:hypothetical protein